MSKLISQKIITARIGHPDDSAEFLGMDEGWYRSGGRLSFSELRSIARLKANNWRIMPGQKYVRQYCEQDGQTYTFKTLPDILTIRLKHHKIKASKMKKEAIAKYIGQKIKEHREKAEMNQEQLGYLLCLSRVSILNLENGRHRPSVDNLFFLCGIFKCQITDLFPPIKAVNIVVEEKEVRVKKKVKVIKIVK